MTDKREPYEYFTKPTEVHGQLYQPGHYYYDEAYNLHGPFNTFEEAQQSLEAYIEWLNDEGIDE